MGPTDFPESLPGKAASISGSQPPPPPIPPPPAPRLSEPFAIPPPSPFYLAAPLDPWPKAKLELRDLLPVYLMALGAAYCVAILHHYVVPISEPLGGLLFGLVAEAFFALAVWYWMKLFARQPFIQAMCIKKPNGGDIGLGIGVGIGILIAAGITSYASRQIAQLVLGHPPVVPTTVVSDLQGIWLLLGIPLVVIAAPICEEILFRGFLFQGLRGRFKFWPAALITSAAFAFIHVNLLRMPGVFVGGILLAFVFEKRKNLVASMISHATLNAIVVAIVFASRH
jgi:membrane protease YdiL (CAAX protease family)